MLDSLGYAAFSEPSPISGGWANKMWRFQTPDGAAHVLRVYGKPEWAGFAFREAAALQAAAGGGIPVPVLEKFGGWQGYPALVISWCEGRPVIAELQRRPWLLWKLSAECGRMHARIHAVEPPDPFRHDPPDHWFSRAGDLNPERHPLPEPAARRLIHLDYHPLNILASGRRLTAVVDWTNAAAGDPKADIARTITLVGVSPIPPGPLRPLMSLIRGVSLRAWLRGYQSEAGPLGDLSLYLAFAGRLTVADVAEAVADGRGWGTEADVQRLRRWTARWERRAGLVPRP